MTLTVLFSQFNSVSGQSSYIPSVPHYVKLNVFHELVYKINIFFFKCNQWLTITSSTLMLLTFALWKSLYCMAPYPQLSQWKSVSFMPLLPVQMLFLIQRSGIRQTIVFFFLVSCLMQTLKKCFWSAVLFTEKLILSCLLTAGKYQIEASMVEFSFKYYSIDCNYLQHPKECNIHTGQMPARSSCS